MIKNWLVTGDTHRDFSRFGNLYFSYNPEETAIIVLGDGGVNICKENDNVKNLLQDTGFTFYFLRGNHDRRPEHLDNIQKIYDVGAGGRVLMQPGWSRIKYLIDGEIYHICGLRILAIGGAYSVDSGYRQQMGLPWFPDEQLAASEMGEIYDRVAEEKFDLVFSHTCPLSFQPTDRFLSFINQSTVDNSMETWMEKLKNNIEFNLWCFGHYHLERSSAKNHYRIIYTDIVNLNDIN